MIFKEVHIACILEIEGPSDFIPMDVGGYCLVELVIQI